MQHGVFLIKIRVKLFQNVKIYTHREIKRNPALLTAVAGDPLGCSFFAGCSRIQQDIPAYR